MGSFRDRFNAWKQGRQVYKDGLRVSFDEGKDTEIQQTVEEPDLQAVLDYARGRKMDMLMSFDSGKDVAGDYNFNAIKQISPNAGLSYGSYYDKLTGDWMMDARRQGVPRFQNGKMTVDQFVTILSPRIYRGLVKRGIQNPGRVLNLMMRQLSHESNRGNSKNVRINNNYAGIGYNPNTKTYKHYDTVDDFVDDYLNLMTGRYIRALDARNESEYAQAIKKRGYFTAPLDEYVSGMRSAGDVIKVMNGYINDNPDIYLGDGPIDTETEPVVTVSNSIAATTPVSRPTYKPQKLPPEFAADRAGRWANMGTPPPLINISRP